MAVRRYTAEELRVLQHSPLVIKPDNLPAIEQWIDEPGQHSNNNNAQNKDAGNTAQRGTRQPRPGLGVINGGGESSPMGSFSTGRPTLSARTSALRGNGDDISLGPPRTMFPSSRNVSKVADPHEKTALAADATTGDEQETARSRFFSDRQLNRRSMNEKEGKDPWTTVKERREGQKDRDDRFVKHDKEDGERRNGFGDRQDPRWPSGRDDRRNGDRPGGWREREQARRERDGDRNHGEANPEWNMNSNMDDPVVKKDQELGSMVPKTQEDFQKWKEQMSKKTKVDDKEEPTPHAEAPPPVPDPKPAVAPLKLDGFDGNLFGGWNTNPQAASQNVATPGTSTTSKATAKPKTSRFASMFKPAAEEPAPVEETPIQKIANGIAKTSAEDQEGFNRVLQMLGSTKIVQNASPAAQEQMPSSPPPVTKPSTTNGTSKPKSRFTDMFAQKSPDRLQSPQQGAISLAGDSLFGSDRAIHEEPQHLFNTRQPERSMNDQQMPQSHAPESARSPDPSVGIPFNAMREQQPRPASGRINDIMFDPPSRGAQSPDINIQNLLAQQRQRPQHTSNESQQLLNLLKKDPSNSRPQSQHPPPSNGGFEQPQYQPWLDQQHRTAMPTETHAPKPRVPQQPPGLFEEQLMRNYPMEQQRQDQGPMQGLPDMAPPQRRPSQRAPPGFYDEQSIFLQQQQQQQLRRHYNEGPPPSQQHMGGPGRRISGHPNLPQMQIPPQQAQQYSHEFHQITSPGGQGPPPPGFNPQMPRHPPGFHNINIFQQPQVQQRDGPPPGFGSTLQSPPANAPPGFFGGPQGMPPGFMQHVRSPIDSMPPQVMRGNPPRGFDAFDIGAQRR